MFDDQIEQPVENALELAAQPEEPKEEIQEQSVPEAEVEEDRPQAVRFKQLRERTERAEYLAQQEAIRAARLEKELQEARGMSAQQSQQPQEDEDWSIGDNQLSEGRHINKLKSDIKRLKEDLNRQAQESRINAERNRLSTEHPDFFKVVNKENLGILSELYPEISATLNADNNVYSAGKSAYTLLKQFGIYKEDNYQVEKERIQKNAMRPKSAAGAAPVHGNSALSQANMFANGLTEQLAEYLRKEMEESISGRR